MERIAYIAYAGGTAATTITWAFILRRFFVNWTVRKNPISLAICGAIGLIIYTQITALCIVLGYTKLNSALPLLCLFNLSSAVNFHFAFKRAKDFPNQRSTRLNGR